MLCPHWNPAGNRIQRIHSSAFKGLANLVIIDFSDNLLTTVPAKALRDATRLQELKLNKNQISTLENETFTGLSKSLVIGQWSSVICYRLLITLIFEMNKDMKFTIMHGCLTRCLRKNSFHSLSNCYQVNWRGSN